MEQSLNSDDALADFTRCMTTIEGVMRPVFVAGNGPAVIVMAEMPGISPHIARFARWVRDAGFTVHLPSLFGRDGAVADAEAGAEVFGAPVSAPSSVRWAAVHRARSRAG